MAANLAASCVLCRQSDSFVSHRPHVIRVTDHTLSSRLAGEDLNEWLAVNTVDFYNAISVLYSTLEDFCTDRTCEIMSAGGKYEYLWADGVKVKRPVRGGGIRS